MKDEIMEVEFSKELNDFLKGCGYTHILSVGIADTFGELKEAKGKDPYWLLPLKAADKRIHENLDDNIIEEINSPDVLDMAAGDDNILFLIKLPVAEMNLFLKKK